MPFVTRLPNSIALIPSQFVQESSWQCTHRNGTHSTTSVSEIHCRRPIKTEPTWSTFRRQTDSTLSAANGYAKCVHKYALTMHDLVRGEVTHTLSTHFDNASVSRMMDDNVCVAKHDLGMDDDESKSSGRVYQTKALRRTRGSVHSRVDPKSRIRFSVAMCTMRTRARLNLMACGDNRVPRWMNWHGGHVRRG